MKKKLMLLLGAMVILATAGAIIIILTGTKADSESTQADNKLRVITTFYPVYMIGLNIADQVEGIEVKSLTDLNTGCLHDYQLTTEDMRLISSADVMVINGGGMEGFLEDVVANYPNLKIIDASQGIKMLSNKSDGEQDYNPHVWLDPKLYIKQIENVRDGLIDYLNDSNADITNISQAIDKNTLEYIQEVTLLDDEIDESMKSIAATSAQSVNAKQVVIFHDAFAYLANRVGMTVTFTVPLDSDTALSAGDIADIIDKVKVDDIKYLFTEEQYSDSIAKQIESETDAKVYIIDSVVTGEGAKDSYLIAMQNNLQVLKEALK
ncbi:MAG: metal ABC transporter substrate-binding protein [Mobilitalea sp.]